MRSMENNEKERLQKKGFYFVRSGLSLYLLGDTFGVWLEIFGPEWFGGREQWTCRRWAPVAPDILVESVVYVSEWEVKTWVWLKLANEGI